MRPTMLAAGIQAVFSISACAQTPQRNDAPKPAPTITPQTTVPIPAVLHFCALHCLTFTLEKDGKLHNYTNLPLQRDQHRVFDVQKFRPDAVVIHRTDTGSYPINLMMNGKMLPGNNTAKGENWALSWGEALERLPPDDRGLAMMNGQQPGQAEGMMLMLLLFGALMGGDSPSTPSSQQPVTLGCAPGVYNYHCYVPYR